MLNEALRLIRVFHDMKQTALCNEFGISRSYLSEIESGKKTPSLDLVQQYSDFFDIPSSSIMLFSEKINTGKRPRTEAGRVKAARRMLGFMTWIAQDAEHTAAHVSG